MVNMASRRFNVQEAISTICDDEFDLSDGELSAEEGEDIYPYLGEPVLFRSAVDRLNEAIVEDDDGAASAHDLGQSEDEEYEWIRESQTHIGELGELESNTGELGEDRIGTDPTQSADKTFPGTSRDFYGSTSSTSSGDLALSSDSDLDGSDSDPSSSSEDILGTGYGRGRGYKYNQQT